MEIFLRTLMTVLALGAFCPGAGNGRAAKEAKSFWLSGFAWPPSFWSVTS